MRTYPVDNPFFRHPYVRDPSSCFRPGDPVMTHLVLDLEVDFRNHVIVGKAELVFDKPGTVALDFTGEVVRLFGRVDGHDCQLAYRSFRDGSGATSWFTLEVPANRCVTVWYRTHSNAAGLHWMDARQTSSKQPMLMSQNQPIGARSWFPCQDTPQVKFIWAATVMADAALHASVLMSDGRNNCARDIRYTSKTCDTFTFTQDKPVPAYLVWLAVGQFEKRECCGVALFAERSVMDRYMEELNACNVDRIIRAGVELFGDLVWVAERFAIFVPPASFPFGGMENTACVAIHPSSMDGHGSSGYIILHELAHTWFGNMVTCATWRDLWLNEGWATWAEQRLVEAVYGSDAAAALYRVNQHALQQTIVRARQSPVQKKLLQIAPNLEDIHPDDALTTLAYHGGASVLFDIEASVGRQAFMRFALDYLQRFRFQAVTTELFAEFLQAQLGDHVSAGIDGTKLAKYMSENPMVPTTRVLGSTSDGVTAVGVALNEDVLPHAQWLTWSAQHRLLYLHGLRDRLPACAMSVLELPHNDNDEVLGMQYEVWVRACAAQNAKITNYFPKPQEMSKLLCRVGRLKIAKPIFMALMATRDGAQLAEIIFNNAAPFMSPQWKHAIRNIVFPNGPTKPAFPAEGESQQSPPVTPPPTAG